MTAFCVFDEDGKWLGHKFQDGVAEVRSFVIAPIYIHFLYRQHRCKEQALPPRRHLIFLPPTLKTQRLGAKTNKYPARYHLVDTDEIPADARVWMFSLTETEKRSRA